VAKPAPSRCWGVWDSLCSTNDDHELGPVGLEPTTYRLKARISPGLIRQQIAPQSLTLRGGGQVQLT
jgi:hypothetical protein